MLRERTFSFWANWVIVVAELSALFAAVLIFAPALGERIIAPFYGDAAAYAALPSMAVNFQRFLSGILGAVMLGWCVSLATIAHVGLRQGERWAWSTLALSIGLWYMTDGFVSLAAGIPLNVAFNTLFLIPFAIPLIATYGPIMRRREAATSSNEQEVTA